MKDTLVKKKREGTELKIKHEATLSEKERLQKEYQDLEIEKDSLEVHVMIIEGEKKYFEAKISELESRESATSQHMMELRTQV